MPNQHYTVREATREDADGIVASHISSILGIAASHYPEEIVKEWADPGNPERLENFGNHLQSGNAVVFVAETENEIIGFSELIPRHNEVRAVYVAANHNGNGVGSSLLEKLENAAKNLGLSELRLSSSVNATNFYSKHGYIIDQRSTHKLRSGAEMDCYKMHKTL